MYHNLKAGDVQGLTVAKPRPKGSVHVEVAVHPEGNPLEFFLLDPPRELPFDAALKAGIRPLRRIYGTDRRMSLVAADADNAMHLVEWVTQHEYPNVADLLEEGRRWGFSRRCELTNEEFALLTPSSLLILVHAKGSIANWAEYGPPLRACPKAVLGEEHVPSGHASWGPHAPPTPTMCAGYWWNDIDGGTAISPGLAGHEALNRSVNRFMPPDDPQWSYGPAYKAPDAVAPRYVPAMIARLPIGGFSVVRDDGPGYDGRLAAVMAAPFPVREVPQ